MRRKKQKLQNEVCETILQKATSGVLAVLDDAGYPYAVPLSFVYDMGKLYFHSAKEGHKIDAIVHHDLASFAVIDQDEIHPEAYTTYFRSVIAFGTVSLVEDAEEYHNAIVLLARKYHPNDSLEHLEEVIAKEKARMTIIKLEVTEMSGKEAIELIKQRIT